MIPRLIVTATDTDVGKTVFAAALTAALGARYWKPVQAGLEGGGDRDTVARLTGLPPDRLPPEAYRLTTPCSPHWAAEIDGIVIDAARLQPPEGESPLVIEGAGGVLTPVTRSLLFADLFATWKAPAVIVARTRLGTINHTLLTVEALRARGVPILGIAFVGDAEPVAESAVVEMGGVRRLGRLAHLTPLKPAGLHAAFAAGFRLEDFR